MTFSMLDSEIDRRPNPNFWSLVLSFLHKQVIQEIQELSQINCDAGRSRAFIRKAINECLLSSYFQSIRKSPSTLKSYYQKYAFLYDTELVETIENLLVGIESYVEFNLPCNSSLLNVWNDAPLQLSGLYSAPLRSLPIASGEDVAGLISCTTGSSRNINIPNRVSVLSDIYAASISNSIFTNSPGSMIMDEDDRMRRLLQKVDSEDVEEVTEELQEHSLEESFEQTYCQEEIKSLEGEKTSLPKQMSESFDESVSESAVMGNSLSAKQSWSEPVQNQEEEQPEAEQIVYHSRSTSVKSTVTVDNQSFASLWNEKQRRTTSHFKEVWERFEKSLDSQPSENIPEDDAPEGSLNIC